MQTFGDVMSNPVQALSEECDYTDEDGFLVCGKCHTRRQTMVQWGGKGQKMPVLCKCRAAQHEEETAQIKKYELERRQQALRKEGITDPQYLQFTFAHDDKQNARVSQVCLDYVEQWQTMKAENIGILFYGTVGTGKSFLACCIANALIEKMVPVCVTNFPRLLNRLQGYSGFEKQAFIDRLQGYDLLVIDDLGTERETAYTTEQIFNVIDSRTRCNKPTIITTNLTIEQLEKTNDMQYKRIYDRVLEMCPVRLVMPGASRRVKNAAEKRIRALELLHGGGTHSEK